jgi:hypothetical protein
LEIALHPILKLSSILLGPNLDEDILSLFDNCISLEENASICEIPMEQEIFMALSEMGSTKAPGPDCTFLQKILEYCQR